MWNACKSSTKRALSFLVPAARARWPLSLTSESYPEESKLTN